jgi:hypothetical protein
MKVIEASCANCFARVAVESQKGIDDDLDDIQNIIGHYSVQTKQAKTTSILCWSFLFGKVCFVISL